MSKYSLAGNDEFDAIVEAILRETCAMFEATVDTRSIKALVLGGGYGRGEGGVIFYNGSYHLYNDLDLFVFSKSSSLFDAYTLRRKLHKLHKVLSLKFGIDVDFSPPKAVSKLRNEAISLMSYDLINGYKTVYGEIDLMRYYPTWTNENLPVDEAVKLLLNRGVGLFLASKRCGKSLENKDFDFINRNIHKAWQALGEAILICENRYHSTLDEKIRRIEDIDILKYTTSNGFIDKFKESMRFKSQPHYVDDAEILYSRIKEIIPVFQTIYYNVWSKLTRYKITSYEDYRYIVNSRYDNKCSMKSIIKNLLLSLRDQCFWGSGLSLKTRYPRLRLFLALPWLLFNEAILDTELCIILGLKTPQSDQALQDHFIKLWKRYN